MLEYTRIQTAKAAELQELARVFLHIPLQALDEHLAIACRGVIYDLSALLARVTVSFTIKTRMGATNIQ